MEYIYKAGKDYVKATISEKDAMEIIESGDVEYTEDFDGFPAKVGDMWFPVEKPRKAQKKAEKPVKAEVVPFEGVSDESDV